VHTFIKYIIISYITFSVTI